MTLSSRILTFKRLWSVMAACLTALSPGKAISASSTGIAITAFGEFGPVHGDTVAAPKTAKGSVTKVATNKLLRRTDCIVAKLGTRMGILVRHAEPGVGYLPVEIEVRHPPITGPNGRTLTSESWAMQLTDQPLYTGWHFGEPYELVPGHYTISVLRNGTVAAQKDFTVVLPGSSCARTS